jgi:spoIIIJ-associated protein
MARRWRICSTCSTAFSIVDVEGHRKREKLDFIGRVRLHADDVRRSGQPYRLPAMNSYDRRLVHQAFVDDPEIATESEEGTARLKHVTLVPRAARTDIPSVT